jgi:hypothetical protein
VDNVRAAGLWKVNVDGHNSNDGFVADEVDECVMEPLRRGRLDVDKLTGFRLNVGAWLAAPKKGVQRLGCFRRTVPPAIRSAGLSKGGRSAGSHIVTVQRLPRG